MGTGLERKYYVFALRALSDITATIFLPVAVVLVCKYLLHIEGPLFYVLLGLAFAGTTLVLWRKIKIYGERFEKLSSGNGSARR